MSNINQLLACLKKVKKVGQDKWVASCPAHNDKSPSLAVTQKPDGIILVKCFGCGANGLDVINALGLDPSSLFPPSDKPKYGKQTRKGFSSWQLLHTLEKDILTVLIAINDFLLNDQKPCQSDVDYLTEVCKRINEGLTYLEGAR